MSDSSASHTGRIDFGDGAREPAGAAPPLAGDELAELRRLLIGPEREQIAQLRHRLDDAGRRAREVGAVLPEAIARRRQPDDPLVAALNPTFEQSLKASVRRNPQPLVDAIAPVMGPAIRRAIADALQRMIQSLGQALDHSLSPRGIGWRFEAFRTGKPFAEIVLLHTLVYRVEQVFLIHRETGLLLQHVSATAVPVKDADMVSGMLTAIQDFCRDSFAAPQGQPLEDIRFGDLTVWVEPGPKAVIAAVIRGTAPEELRLTLQEALERIHVEQREALEGFEGDASPFELSRPLLERCLVEAARGRGGAATKRPMSKLWKVTSIGAATVIVALIIWGWIASARADRRWNDLVARLKAEPGIVVTEAARNGAKYSLSGLRDPLAIDPASLVQSAGFDPARVAGRWEPYQALTSPFILARAKAALAPPGDVQLSFDQGSLRATGSAPQQWLADAARIARALPGVDRFDATGVRAIDETDPRLAEVRLRLRPPTSVRLDFHDHVLIATGAAPHAWVVRAGADATTIAGVQAYAAAQLVDLDRERADALARRLSDVSLQFESRETKLSPGQQTIIEGAARQWSELQAAAHDAEMSAELSVIGYAGAEAGTDWAKMAANRAAAVKDALVAAGIDPAHVSAVVGGVSSSGAGGVDLKSHLVQATPNVAAKNR